MVSKLFLLVCGILLIKVTEQAQFRITTALDPPFVMNKVGGGYEGIVIDILKAIAQDGNFSYTISLVKDGRWGGPTGTGPNATWNGMIGELHRNESDISAGTLHIIPQRAAVVRLTQPYFDSGMRIVYKRPVDWMKNESLFVLLGVFSPALWVVVLVSLLAVTGIFLLVSKFSPLEDPSFGDRKKEPEAFNILNSFLYTFSSLTWQSYSSAPRSISGRILASFWWMFSVLTLVAFTANLTAYFLTHEPNISRVPFTTFRELLYQRKISFGSFQYGISGMFWETTDIPLAKGLYRRIQKNKNYITSMEDGLKKVRQGNFALIVDGAKAAWYVGQQPCDLVVVGKPLNELGYSFACRNGTTICNYLDHKIIALKEQDVIYNITNKWMNKGCNADKAREVIYDGVPYIDTFGSRKAVFKDKAVTMKRFASGFILLFVGIVLAALVLVVEIVYAKRGGYQVNVLSGMRSTDQQRIQDSFNSGK